MKVERQRERSRVRGQLDDDAFGRVARNDDVAERAARLQALAQCLGTIDLRRFGTIAAGGAGLAVVERRACAIGVAAVTSIAAATT